MGMQKPRVKFKGRVIGKFPIVEPKVVIPPNPDHIQDNITRENAQVKSEPLYIPNLDHILQLSLSKLSRRNIALRIYSEVLGCEIWLCGNEQMAAQLRQDDPQTVVYTADELRKLYKLQPSPEDLRAIHNTKDVFEGSRIIDSSLKGNGDESGRT